MAKELKVGLLAIVSILVLVLGFQFLKGAKVFSKENTYYAMYDKVDGLYSSDPVYVNGFQIGRVKDIELARTGGSTKVLVSLSIDKKYEIPNNSVALLYSTDLLGEKSVAVMYGSGSTMLMDGDTVGTKIQKAMLEEMGSQITPLTEKIDGLITNLDTLLSGINYLFYQKNDESLYAIVHNLKVLSDDLPEISGGVNTLINSDQSKLNTTLANLESITGNIEKNNAKIDNILTNFSSFSDSLNQTDLKGTVNNAKIALSELQLILETVNNGDGTITQLLKDPEVYNNLETATNNLNALLEDLKQNPGRYVNFSLIKVNKTEQEKAIAKEKRKNRQLNNN